MPCSDAQSCTNARLGMRSYEDIRQFANPTERMVGVLRGAEEVVVSSAEGGKGRLAAQRMSMFPIHSPGPCMQDTASDDWDALDVQILSELRSGAELQWGVTYFPMKESWKSTLS